MTANAIRIVLLGYPGVQTLDLAGPLDAFASANSAQSGAYITQTASLTGAPFASESGLRIVPDGALHDMRPIDTLIVPGGAALRSPGVYEEIAKAVLPCSADCRRIVSVCTGIYGVAPTGLLDGRRVTTHWRFAADVAARFPALRLDCDRIFVKDGRLYTSAGITAAIDLALALIEEDYGPKLALTVARDLVVYLKRSGGQRQYSEPLQFQARAGDRLADLAAWIASHLGDDLSVEQLAARAALSPRQFSRRFTRAFGRSPSEQIEELRLDAARNHLTGSGAQVEAIAAALGFRSNDAFRRAFDRRFGLSPAEYRRRFPPDPLTATGDRDADFAQR
jgi:transcriptional regulator GlxA family with amidase domain